ncbi:phospholipase B1, membrane-associated-like [Tigriopus californicus]|uniref:phospholipase B1, membrane-associated-like n=1 Tax=Tigriopus californicus TaxID=6832 RepID=UPI0027DA78A4|nr:phospholipase B1, membrane-associated-like [Tigriopus californicus]
MIVLPQYLLPFLGCQLAICGAQNGFSGSQALLGIGDTLVGQPLRTLVAGGVAGTNMVNQVFLRTTNASNQAFLNQRNRRSCQLNADLPFPCGFLEKSYPPPKSVHKLRPGDIQVIAGLGDSISAGTGALSKTIFEVGSEFRGVAFAAGGIGTWRHYLTIPNILKQFNPYLYGFSTGITKVGRQRPEDDKKVAFNLAISGSESDDVIKQAHRLVEKMFNDPKINAHKDWKMITIFIGHNDICGHACEGFKFYEDKEVSFKSFRRNMQRVLDILHKDLPRTFVNLIPAGNLGEFLDIGSKPLACQAIHQFICPCLFDDKFTSTLSRFRLRTFLQSYLWAIQDLVSSGRYDTREDFTVVIQPATVNAKIPRTRRNDVDLNYLAPDCFHWSQKLHSNAARALWNNLLEPIGMKSTDFVKDSVAFLCPTEEFPYLATSQNNAYSGGSDESHPVEQLSNDFVEMMSQRENQNRAARCPLYSRCPL